MKKIWICLICLSMVCGLVACGNSEQENTDYFGFQKKDFIVVEETDTHGGFHGDGSYYLIMDCSENKEKALEILSGWKELPLSEDLSLIMYGGEKDGMTYAYNLAEGAKIPRVENGYYYFCDRHSGTTDSADDSGLFSRGSFNFSIAIYDSDTDTTVPVSVEKSQIEDEQELEFIYDEKIRKVWDGKQEEWYFSVVDVIQLLTDSSDPKQYIKKLRVRDVELNNKWGTICTLLKMPALDGKMRRIQMANSVGIFRIIQSIPSPKAEPFKQWLAQVGAERLDEIADPEKAMNRAVSYYQRKGYSDAWITQRIRSIEIRKEMTDEWKRAGISTPPEYAALRNVLTHTWSGKTVQEYKALKGLKKENLRDNMTNTELVLNQLAEISTTELSRNINPQGYEETENVTVSGGQIAANARKELEGLLGRSIISPLNATSPIQLDDTKKS